MKISRDYKTNNIHWSYLPKIKDQIEAIGVVVDSVSVEIDNYPDTIEYSSLDEASRIGSLIESPYFRLSIDGKKGDENFYFYLTKLRNIHGQDRLVARANDISSASELDSITSNLGLVPDDNSTPYSEKIKRSIFIAHRFNETGIECADKIARFLELLGFSVSTGRGFAPTSVGEKVKARMERMAIVFVILSPGDDDTWLIQESILALAKDKPIFILKDISSDFKPAILGDQEYIPFQVPAIESAYISILEGLKELGLLNYSE